MPGPDDPAVRDIIEGIIADDDAEEEALELALALALQSHATLMQAAIEISDDDDDDDDDDGSSTASASSEDATQQTTQPAQQTTPTPMRSQRSQPSSQQSQSQFGSVTLDRRAMEQERLNRLAKRQRPATDDDDDDDVVEVPPPKKQATRAPAGGNIKTLGASASASASTNRAGQSSSSSSNVPYPNPTVKRTWIRGTPRRGDEITIEEVFQKDKLELAVLSSFQWDEEWMLSKLDYTRTKILLLAFARDEAQVLKSMHVSPSFLHL
jgi:hypothetical protein